MGHSTTNSAANPDTQIFESFEVAASHWRKRLRVGAYENFKKLTRPKSFVLQSDTNAVNRNFNFKSLNSNVVVRWEYRPGSTVFVVWQQQKENLDHPGELNFIRDLDDLFRTSGDHIFLIKASFWMNL